MVLDSTRTVVVCFVVIRKLSDKIQASLAVLISASCPALADNHVGTSLSWDVIEAGYFYADIEDDSTLSGFNASFLKSLGDNIYLTGRYRDVSEDMSIFGEI